MSAPSIARELDSVSRMHSVSRIAAASSFELHTELSDSELLTATRCLVGRSNQLLASLLVHLAEVEIRGLHRTRACSSLYTYCIYELRFSEDEACRRVTAARLVRRFPPLLDAVASGELHLTGLLMLGPHLTSENLGEVLARAKHRTKKEIARLVRQLDPLPDVPARIEPLGPAPARTIPATPTFSQFVESLCPVRELPPGDRPRDWIAGTDCAERADEARPAPARQLEGAQQVSGLPAPARLEPQRYRVQFTAGEEYVNLVEEAQALLSHSAERVPLDELQLRAMRALVAELGKRRRAVTKRAADGKTAAPASDAQGQRSAPEPKASLATPESSEPPSSDHRETAVSEPREIEERASSGPEHPRQRGRHIPAAVRRAVFERDAGQCAYVDASGQRCRETHTLELHHVKAFAMGGEHRLENLALRCRAHNALAAEEDFGADRIEQSRDSSRHESFRRQAGY